MHWCIVGSFSCIYRNAKKTLKAAMSHGARKYPSNYTVRAFTHSGLGLNPPHHSFFTNFCSLLIKLDGLTG
jgi:hypothetical protein